MPKSSRTVILGHSGFIGRCIHAEIARIYPNTETIGLSYPDIDLCAEADLPRLEELCEPSTTVVMCSGIKKQYGDDLHIFRRNIRMIENLCRLLEKRPVRRLIFLSSAGVYGEETDNLQITESTRIAPSSYYGTAKFASERLLAQVFANQDQGTLLTLRPPLAYGPGDTSRSYGPSGFIWGAMRERKITLWGQGDELRDLVFVDDIATIVARLLFERRSATVNLATGTSVSFRQMAELAATLVPHEVEIIVRDRTKPKADQGYLNTALLELLPDLSFTELSQGMACIYNTERQSGTPEDK